MKTIIKLNGLSCANCAAKIEEDTNKLDGVEKAFINFAKSTLNINVDNAKKDSEIFNEVEGIVDKYEPSVVVELVSSENIMETPSKVIKKEEDAHEHSTDRSVVIKIIIAFVLTIVGAVVTMPTPVKYVFFGVAVLLCGAKVLKQGFKNLVRFNFEENFLMTVAVIAAFIIGEAFEGAMVMVLFTLGEYIEGLAMEKSRKSISALSDIRPDTANIILKDGSSKVVDAKNLLVGTKIQIKAGERVPIDATIIEGYSTVDTSAMTGESIPISVVVGDKLLSGTINQSGLLIAETTNTFDKSAASRIIELVEESVANRGETENFITKFAKIYTPVVMVLAVLLATVPPLLGMGTFNEYIYNALSFLVASCPCAFVIAVPLGFYSAIGANSRSGVLVKGGKYIEKIAQAKTVVLDKTGTITSGDLMVNKILSHDKSFTKDDILEIAAKLESFSNHPIAESIVKAYGKNINTEDIKNYKEIAGKGLVAEISGKIYLCGSKALMDVSNISTDKTDLSNIYLAVDDKIIGQIFISDTIKESSKNIVKNLKRNGVKNVIMLTGDHKSAADSVAKEIGIDYYKSNLLPEDKVEEFKKIIENEENTPAIFVGDGINDAPALALADVGASIGLGSDVAIESSDMVLMSGDLKDLSNSIEISKKSMRTIRFLIALSLGVKFIVLILSALGLSTMQMAVFADVGVSIIAILVATRVSRYKGAL